MKYTWNLISTIGLITLLIDGAFSELPKVRIEMDEAGMHRKLKYHIQFDSSFVGSSCQYVLSQPLPAAVYISTDELDDLQRLLMLNAVYPKFVDIEAITEKSASFSVLLRGEAKLRDTLTLPIHFRYHAASDKRSTATVVIDSPMLYLNCAVGNNDTITSNDVYCVNEHKSSMEKYYRHTPRVDCSWLQAAIELQQKGPIRADIPVGNSKEFPPVLYMTIVLSWVVSLWTVFCTQSVPRRINRELSQQRFFQHQKSQ